MSDETLISVCICTFRRPEGLTALLHGLTEQKDTGCKFEVVVVDNDAAGSARTIVTRTQEQFPALPIRYAVEPQQNIALARNLTVRLASGGYLAFIDDDETPAPDWLGRMYSTLREHTADAVFGPVLPELPPRVPAWVRRGRFFERPRHATGTAVPAGEARTSNALVRAELLKKLNGPFDAHFGRTSGDGEDTDCFARMLSAGARFVWCDEAVVREYVAPERVRLSWLLRRSLVGGWGYAQHRFVGGGPAVRLGLAVRGLGALVLGPLLLPVVLPFGIHHGVHWLQRSAAGAGKLLAFTPFRREEFRA